MNYLEIDEKNIQSFDYEKTIASNSKILGSCELGKAEIQLLNNENEYSSYKNNWIKTQFGSMFIYDVKPVQEKVNISLSCYDIKYKLDVKYDKSIFESLFPCTLLVWREAIATYCGISFADNRDFANADYILNTHPFIEDDASCRNVIGLIAEAGASSVDTDFNDYFYFVFNVDKSNVVNDWLDLTTEKENTQPVNMVVLGRGDVEDIEIYPNPQPENAKELRINNNYILDPQDTTAETDRRKEVIEPIYNRVNGFNYIPFELRTQDIDNKLDLKLGQKIVYQDIYDNEIEAYLMTISYKYLGGDLEDSNSYEVTLSAEELGETNSNYSYAGTPGEKINKVGADVDKINNEIKLYVKSGDVVNQINLSEQAIELIGNRLIVKADNLEILEDGTLICNNATIRKGNLILEDDGTGENSSITIKTTHRKYKDLDFEVDLNGATLIQTFGNDFNFEEINSGIIFITDNQYRLKLEKTILGSVNHTYGIKHQIILTNNNDYEEIIYEVIYYTEELRYETITNIEEILLPEDFGKVVGFGELKHYLSYFKKLIVDYGETNYSSSGMTAKIYSNEKYKSSDLIKLRDYINGTAELTEEEITFLDANSDGKLNVADLLLILNNGGWTNVSDTNPGEFIIDTTALKENMKIVDAEGNIITAIGIDGIKVMTKDTYLQPQNFIEIGEALTYRQNSAKTICGTWRNGKIIYRQVIEITDIEASTEDINLGYIIDNLDEVTDIRGMALNEYEDWISVNFPYGSNYVACRYNKNNGLIFRSSWAIQKAHIIIEYTE